MSYTYWRFKVTFFDGTTQDYSVTGTDSNDAMANLAHDLASGTTGGCELVKSVEYLHCDTFGIDAESDRALSEEAANAAGA
jgi:hypothetical protein